MTPRTAGLLDEETILTRLIQLLQEVTEDWDTGFDGGVTADTRLVADLEFESIDVAMLVAQIQRGFGHGNLPFNELFSANGSYVADIQVRTLAEFLYRRLRD